MNCPKCKETGLRKREYNAPHFCPLCGGLWLAGALLDQLPELALDSPSTTTEHPEHDNKTGLCPEGHRILTRAKVDADPPFYLEKCVECHGIWFDKGEWLRFAETHIQDNLLEIWSISWQREQRKIKKESEIERLYKEKLGEEMYTTIILFAQAISSHPERNQALMLFKEELKRIINNKIK
jgi:Zn-finger nucleic acid-binding protein